MKTLLILGNDVKNLIRMKLMQSYSVSCITNSPQGFKEFCIHTMILILMNRLKKL